MRQIHIPTRTGPTPSQQEIFVAQIVSKHFKTDVFFMKRHNNIKTADIKFKNKIWEIKSPLGGGKRTMQNNLRSANSQSHNIIIDLTRCRMRQDEAIRKIGYELDRANTIKHLIIIRKDRKILELK